MSAVADDVLEGIPEEQLERLAARLEAKGSLAAFIAHSGYLGETRAAAHHRLLIEHLEAVEHGDIRRLMVLMPPGSAKSTYASVLFPPWFIGRNPRAQILGVSNSTELAEKWSRRVRSIVATREFRDAFGFGLNEAHATAGSWENERGGEYFAAGMSTAIAGRRADLAIIDDPIRTREEADSESLREKQWEWFCFDYSTRLKPAARQVLIQTRWHEDDLAGRILEREATDWTVLELPMEARADDPLGRVPGERLWPEWFTAEMVEHAKLEPRSWNALYQQDPVPDSGEYFKREHLREYEALPESLRLYGASDYAVTEGRGDYTEHGIFGLDPRGDLYVMAWWYGQTGPDTWIELQVSLMEAHSPLIWFGESGVIRNATEGVLRNRMLERQVFCRLEWLPSIADKPTRARAIQARVAMGKVFLPKVALWKEHVVSALLKFPAGKVDDPVDVFSLIGRGLEHLRAPSVRPDHAQRPPPSWPPRPSVNPHRKDGLSWMSL